MKVIIEYVVAGDKKRALNYLEEQFMFHFQNLDRIESLDFTIQCVHKTFVAEKE